jgi:hypothetical protein
MILHASLHATDASAFIKSFDNLFVRSLYVQRLEQESISASIQTDRRLNNSFRLKGLYTRKFQSESQYMSICLVLSTQHYSPEYTIRHLPLDPLPGSYLRQQIADDTPAIPPPPLVHRFLDNESDSGRTG